MKVIQRSSVIRWIVAAMAVLPLLLYAYLGQFIRLMADDYYYFHIAEEFGAWGSLLYHKDKWLGSYTHNFVHGLLAPFGPPNIPPVFPAIIIVLWLIGLTWLKLQILAKLQLRRNRLPVALTLSALTIAATIQAFDTFEPIYWYSASIRYTLPLALSAIYLAAAFQFAGRLYKCASITLAALCAATFCFINAGFSELFATMQLVYFSLLLVGICVGMPRSAKRVLFVLITAGLIATVASLAVQLTAKGVSVRIDVTGDSAWAFPIRSLPSLIGSTLVTSFQYVGDQQVFTGFAMLFCVALFATLSLYKPTHRYSISMSCSSTSLGPVMLILFVQLCFIPALWTHSSDNPQVLGRFSHAFMTVVILNLVLIIAPIAIIVNRRRIGAALTKHSNRFAFMSSAFLLFILVLFLMTQVRNIHYRAASYLLITSLTLLGTWTWSAASALASGARRFGLYAVLSLAMVFPAILVPTATGLYIYGMVFPRILALATFIQVSAGLVWGAYVGFIIREVWLVQELDSKWIKGYQVVGFSVALIITSVMVVEQLSLVPNFALYAREWDARHRQIIQLRDSGAHDIEVAPYTFHLPDSITVPRFHSVLGASFYGVDSIRLLQN